MEPLYSLLTFPQYFKQGHLHFNIMVLPRNINLYKPIEGTLPSFVEADFSFETKIINHLAGLPITPNITEVFTPQIISEPTDRKIVIDEVIKQLELSDNLKISENVSQNNDAGFNAQKEKLKNIAIKKYLPHSYRNAFNFTSPRSRYCLTDDEYECSIKNKEKKQTDLPTNRNLISWGKLIAFIIRNPLLAEKAGLIYKAKIKLENNLLEKGGWLFHTFGPNSSYKNVNSLIYACRIPKLKDDRQLFAPVLFPVKSTPFNNTTYDAVIQESILYNDGFAKIIHANQPINQDLLNELDPSNPPLKDVGIRLGWDDEQLTIWGNRQLKQQDEVTEQPIDAPLGVFGYKIDVKKPGDENWFSQNLIVAPQDISFGAEQIIKANQPFELSLEVHPSSHGDTINEGFWMPMYYTSWNGKSNAIPDKEAQEIHQLYSENIVPVDNRGDANALNNVPKTSYHPYIQEVGSKVPLLYGEDYEFRIRMMDISGGGPTVADQALNGGQNPVAKAHFTRNIGASALQIVNSEDFFHAQKKNDVKDMSILENVLNGGNTLTIKRPLLSYPSVLYTGKYKDAAKRLKEKITNIPAPANLNQRNEYIVGLPDPDVNSFKMVVEVKSLEMDNALSENGNESYIFLFEKVFEIPKNAVTENYDLEATIKITYQDYESINPKAFDIIGAEDELVLPTSRHLRISAIPLVDGANGSNDYASEFIREGKKTIFTSYKSAAQEKNLLSEINGGLRAFYLQPERKKDPTIINHDEVIVKKAFENETSVELQRLADALNLAVRNLTVEGFKGSRVQFGASSHFKHSLAPDSASLNFSSVKELFNRWIIAVDFSLQRDWFWDGLQPLSFVIKRKITISGNVVENEIIVGDIQIKDTANINMLQGNVDRNYTRILFLDVVDPELLNNKFPREIEIEYSLHTNFKESYPTSAVDEFKSKSILLPVTQMSRQIPKLISVGLAMTPYQYDEEKYQFSEERQKYLWLEFDHPPEDPMDTYYARVLAYSPDPYLCTITNELLASDIPDLPFALNEEKIREIIPTASNDFAGVGLMQELIPENTTEGTKTYLLPLPETLHANSDELFGFFTYEIRVGHKKELWSTAQARFGRPLKVNGVQHPTPELLCNINRGEKLLGKAKIKNIEISAKFANAVLNGKNITASPPNTSLWYLLYTQVMQADGESFRNILIDSGPLRYLPEVATVRKSKANVISAKTIIPLQKISLKLEQLGLSHNNPISAIAVEMFPLDNNWQLENTSREFTPYGSGDIWENKNAEPFNPLTNQLGEYRILRSSKLTPLTEMCCQDC